MSAHFPTLSEKNISVNFVLMALIYMDENTQKLARKINGGLTGGLMGQEGDPPPAPTRLMGKEKRKEKREKKEYK